jgi:hypothetical protein
MATVLSETSGNLLLNIASKMLHVFNAVFIKIREAHFHHTAVATC